MTVAQPTADPTFGNLRKPRAAGINNLSKAVTYLLFLGLLVFILMSLTVGLLPAAIELVGVAVTAAVFTIRDRDDLTAIQRITRRTSHRRARGNGSNLYRAGLIGHVPGRTTQLPGLAAQSTLAEGWDSYGRRFAVIHHPATSDYVAVFGVEPDGDALVDSWVVADRVAHWGAFLASLGDEPGLAGCAVTIESAPDTGHRLARVVEQAIDPNSPPIAQAMLHEVVARYPEGSATIRGYVTLTFSAAPRAGARRRDTTEVVRDLASRLPKLMERLQQTGAGAVRPIAGDELCEVVAVAYDPAAAAVVEAVRAAGEELNLTWEEVGPAGADARWDHYVHDGAVSATWGMNTPPKGTFHSNTLADLLAPHRDIARKRVTLLYETVDSGKAADMIQKDVNDTQVRASTACPSATLQLDAAAALKAAQEEAAGAGVVNIGMLVTATVLDPGLQPGQKVTKRNRTREGRLALALDDAVAAVDSLGAGAKIRLRRMYGSQDAAFTAALPIGLNLIRHLRLPTELRNAM